MTSQTVAARTERLPAATGVVSAIVAASCCLLPIALIALGIAGAGFIMTMMRYEWITLPLGVTSLAGAYAFYFRGRRRCDAAGCRFVGQRLTQRSSRWRRSPSRWQSFFVCSLPGPPGSSNSCDTWLATRVRWVSYRFGDFPQEHSESRAHMARRNRTTEILTADRLMAGVRIQSYALILQPRLNGQTFPPKRAGRLRSRTCAFGGRVSPPPPSPSPDSGAPRTAKSYERRLSD